MNEQSAAPAPAPTQHSAERPASPAAEVKAIKAEDVRTLLDFFRYAYQQGGRRLSLKKSVAKSMDPNKGLEPGSVEEVRGLARQDPDLKVPPQILTTLDKPGTPDRLRNAAANLLGAGLKDHPVLSAPLTQLDQGGGLDEALGPVVAMTEEEVAQRMGAGEWKGKRVAELKGAAISTCALLEAVRRPMTADVLAGTLQKHLWRPAFEDRPPPSERAALLGTPSLITHGLIVDIFHRQVSRALEDSREAQELVQAAEANRDEARQLLAGELNRSAALTGEVSLLQNRITELERDLAAERERLQLTRTEGSYEYERLRARLQRRLKSDVELLQEGLHALQRGKPHVMEDRAERALEALEAELENLKGDPRP